MKIAVLIPCYNEELTVEKVVSDFKRELPEAEIYVYDNNSKDKTAELAVKAGAIRQLREHLQHFSPVRVGAAVHVPLDTIRHHVVNAAVAQGTGLSGDVFQVRNPVHGLLRCITVQAPVAGHLPSIAVHDNDLSGRNLELNHILTEGRRCRILVFSLV